MLFEFGNAEILEEVVIGVKNYSVVSTENSSH